jgi:hypothetical protein
VASPTFPRQSRLGVVRDVVAAARRGGWGRAGGVTGSGGGEGAEVLSTWAAHYVYPHPPLRHSRYLPFPCAHKTEEKHARN